MITNTPNSTHPKNILPLLSVIVPVYNTEMFLPACLDSILSGTYTNLEVIVVNDGTQDNSEEIIINYQKRDSRIKYICSQENQGLFAARLRGYEAATGTYICSVDSDDTVGIDYHRVLMKKALETNADIVLSKFVVYESQTKKYHYRTLGNYEIERINFEGTQVLQEFLRTNGESSVWWLVWNKIYKKSLWDKCYDTLIKHKSHQVMLEDIIYGSVFLSQSKRCVFVDCDAYFYNRHPNASTGGNKDNKIIEKNINDIRNAFIFIVEYFEAIGQYKNAKGFLNHLANWTLHAWTSVINRHILNPITKKNLLNQIESLIIEPINNKSYDFFYAQHTEWNNGYENIKKKILDSRYRIISFDVFDTLIVRSFYEPYDLFKLMNNLFNDLTKRQTTDFHTLRINAEKLSREQLKKSGSNIQDVTISQIYSMLSELYNIEKDIINKLMEKEIELEIKYAYSRNSIKELFELAKHVGKMVICISDMYLPSDVITTMLEKSGYSNLDNLFVSSEIGMMKSSGDMYKYVIKSLKCNKEDILHIGDNWHSDKNVPANMGIAHCWIPRSIELFRNQIGDNDGKRERSEIKTLLGTAQENSYLTFFHADQSLSLRSAMAITANKIFDNPYLPYKWGSNFNMSPYYIGFSALGIYTLSIVMWMYKTAKKDGKKRINFIARDGYIPMKVFELLSSKLSDCPTTNYIYMSRRSSLPLLFPSSNDLYSLEKYFSFNRYTVEDVLSELQPLFKGDFKEQENTYKKRGIIFDARIETVEQFSTLVNAIIEISYDDKINEVYRKKMSDYFKEELQPNSVMYDVGYSGRSQAILTELLGEPIDAYYIHKNGNSADMFEKKYGFSIQSFLEYRPTITGDLREILLSEIGPGCIQYDTSGDKVVPIFDEYPIDYQGKFVLEEIQRGTMEFCRIFLETFDDYFLEMDFLRSDASFIHEWFLHSPAEADMQLFKAITREKSISSGIQGDNVYEHWKGVLNWGKQVERKTNGHIQNRQIDSNIDMLNQMLLRQSIYYTLRYDRKNLKLSIWLKMQNKPIIFNITKKIYRGIKKTFNFTTKKKLN